MIKHNIEYTMKILKMEGKKKKRPANGERKKHRGQYTKWGEPMGRWFKTTIEQKGKVIESDREFAL